MTTNTKQKKPTWIQHFGEKKIFFHESIEPSDINFTKKKREQHNNIIAKSNMRSQKRSLIVTTFTTY